MDESYEGNSATHEAVNRLNDLSAMLTSHDDLEKVAGEISEMFGKEVHPEQVELMKKSLEVDDMEGVILDPGVVGKLDKQDRSAVREFQSFVEENIAEPSGVSMLELKHQSEKKLTEDLQKIS